MKRKENFYWSVIIVGMVLFFGLLKYFSITKKTGGLFVFPTDDTYITLSYSIQMGRGFPFQFNDEDPPIPMEPSLLAQIVYSAGYKIGFKSVKTFSGFVFWINLFLLAFTLTFIFLIFQQCIGSVSLSLISTFMIFLYTPFRYIFALGMGHSFFSLFFYLNVLFFLKRRNFLFLLSGIFLALSRPESLFVLLTFIVYFLLTKEHKLLIASILTVIVWAIFPLTCLMTFGKLVPSGFLPQSIFTYYSKGAAMGYITEYIIEYIKGILIGIYSSSAEKWYINFYYSSLPIGLFLFSIASFFNKNLSSQIKKVSKILLSVFIVYLFVSSFTLYKGVHLLRHTAWTLPIIFFFAVLGIEFICNKTKFSSLRYFLYSFYFLYLLGITIDFESKNVSLSIHKSYPHYVAGEWIKRNINGGEFIAITPSRLKFFTGKKIYSFSPGTNWRISKFSSNYYPSHYFEFLKYEIKKDVKYFVYWDAYDEEVPIFEWFKFLSGEIIYEQRFLSGTYIKIGKMRVDRVLNAEKIYTIDSCETIDHIDVGDPLSEKKHNYYSYLYEPIIKLRPYPIIGKAGNKEIIEGGIFCIQEKFNFYLNHEDIKDSIFLVGRVAKRIYYSVIFHKSMFSNFVELPVQKIDIYLNKKLTSQLLINDVENFTEFKVFLPTRFLKLGVNEIIIMGPHISTSYWIVKKY